MAEHHQESTDIKRRLKTGAFWLVVIILPVLMLEAWDFAIARFVVALIMFVVLLRVVEFRLRDFGWKPPLVIVHAATYALAVGVWGLLTYAGPRTGHPVDFLSPARMFAVPALCWLGYNLLRERRMRPPATPS